MNALKVISGSLSFVIKQNNEPFMTQRASVQTTLAALITKTTMNSLKLQTRSPLYANTDAYSPPIINNRFFTNFSAFSYCFLIPFFPPSPIYVSTAPFLPLFHTFAMFILYFHLQFYPLSSCHPPFSSFSLLVISTCQVLPFLSYRSSFPPIPLRTSPAISSPLPSFSLPYYHVKI